MKVVFNILCPRKMSSILAMTCSYIPKHFITATLPIFDSVTPRVKVMNYSDAPVLMLSSTFELTRDIVIFCNSVKHYIVLDMVRSFKQPRSIVILGWLEYPILVLLKRLVWRFHDLEYLDVAGLDLHDHPSAHVRVFARSYDHKHLRPYDELFPDGDKFAAPEYIFNNMKLTTENLERLRDDFPSFTVNDQFEALRFVINRYKFYNINYETLRSFIHLEPYVRWVLLGYPLTSLEFDNAIYNWSFEGFTSEEIYKELGDDIVNLYNFIKQEEFELVFGAVPNLLDLEPVDCMYSYLRFLSYNFSNAHLQETIEAILISDELTERLREAFYRALDNDYYDDTFLGAYLRHTRNIHCYHKYLRPLDTVMVIHDLIEANESKSLKIFKAFMDTDNGMTVDEKHKLIWTLIAMRMSETIDNNLGLARFKDLSGEFEQFHPKNWGNPKFDEILLEAIIKKLYRET